MMIGPTGIKISFGGRPGVSGDSRAVVARISGFSERAKDELISREMVIPAGEVVEEELPHGLYNVQLTLPSGRILQHNVKIAGDSNETYEFLEDFAPNSGFSLQEASGRDGQVILAEASLSSAAPAATGYADQPSTHIGASPASSTGGDLQSASQPPAAKSAMGALPSTASLTIRTGGFRAEAESAPGGVGWNSLTPDEQRGECGLWRIRSTVDLPRSIKTRTWARIELPDGRIEVASIPQPWFCTATREFAPAEILVDPQRSEGAATTVAVHDTRLAGLLAYLDRGHAGAAKPLLEELERENLIQQTIFDKKTNSLAACAAAYVGLSVYPPDEREEWDGWLENCMRLFPGVPDAAIVHARRLLLRPDDSGSNEAAAKALRKACKAGPPYFSAGVSLLREMLLLLSSDHPDLSRRVDRAARLAARVDPTQIFTVLRYSPPSSSPA